MKDNADAAFKLFISIMILMLIIAILANKAEAQTIDLSRFGGSIGLYAPIDQNVAEFGSGGIVQLSIRYEMTKNWSIEYIHKSYLLTGQPFQNTRDKDCGPDTQSSCESTFDAIGIKWEF